LSGIRELYDLIDDVFYRLKNNFNIILNTGQMKWIKPEEKAMACKVKWKKSKIILKYLLFFLNLTFLF